MHQISTTNRTTAIAASLAATGAALLALAAASPAQVTVTGPAPTPASVSGQFAGVVSTPIEARQLTDVAFGDRSHWRQPWRAFLDTPPASQLRNAVGINFNPATADAPAVARVLGANGFRRARIEIPWGEVDYANPDTLWRAAQWATKLRALKDAGLRPLVLLNSDDGRPAPMKPEALRITNVVTPGARTVELDTASAQRVIPGRTGLNARKPAEYLITRISGRTATLARPSPYFVPPGEYPASTLLYEPFSPVIGPNGAPNPAGEATLKGWLRYVQTVTSFVRAELGSTAFDVEISNEGNLNAAFYDINRYYAPPPFPGRVAEDTIVDRSVRWIKDPVNGLDGVRVSNGFSSQRPWDSAATSPVGLDALSKHSYPRYLRFPAGPTPWNRPIDAAGRVSGNDSRSGWRDQHNPTYRTFFPEFSLTAIMTESIIRDTAPITTRIRDLSGRTSPHGRDVRNAAGRPVELWMTEIGLETGVAKEFTRLSYADEEHLRAKAALRTLTSYVNKGVTQIDFFAAAMAEWTLIGRSFWEKLASTGQYPGDTSGGPTLTGIRRLTETLGTASVTTPRQLRLDAIGDYAGRRQFTGDGSAARPTLYDRDVLAFLPFQASNDRFVIPVYVMTRNMAAVHKTDVPATDPTRFDLPAERYQLTIGGVDANTARVRATDPLTGASVPVDVVRRTAGGWLVVELRVTDSPRLLIIENA